jgi:hypothetical protein
MMMKMMMMRVVELFAFGFLEQMVVVEELVLTVFVEKVREEVQVDLVVFAMPTWKIFPPYRFLLHPWLFFWQL